MWLHIPTSLFSAESECSTLPSMQQFQHLAASLTVSGKAPQPQHLRRVWGKEPGTGGSTSGSTGELCLPLFPPGPGDTATWQHILAERPDLAPAVESAVRGVAHGSASRVHRLRALGNGVVPLQAAVALRELLRGCE